MSLSCTLWAGARGPPEDFDVQQWAWHGYAMDDDKFICRASPPQSLRVDVNTLM